MVIRRPNHNRKHLGARRWGKGNIKNARGAGDRGGVGWGGRKHKFTLLTAKYPERIRKKGFAPWRRSKLLEISLREIDAIATTNKEQMPKLVFKDSKVLGNGNLTKPVHVSAVRFSKSALEKIKAIGGEAIMLSAKTQIKPAQ